MRDPTQFIKSIARLDGSEEWAEKFPPAPNLQSMLLGNEDVLHRKMDLKKWAAFVPTARSVVKLLTEADTEGRIEDIILVGSLGKDTAVNPETADIDLLVRFKVFQPKGGAHYDELLQWVEGHLGSLRAQISRFSFYFRSALGVPPTACSSTEGLAERDSYNYGGMMSRVEAGPTGVTSGLMGSKVAGSKREAAYLNLAPADGGPGVDILIGCKMGSVAATFREDNEEDWVFYMDPQAEPSATSL